jgi:hypothetical protein
MKYRDAHVSYDKDNKDNFGGYKLLIADVVNGKLTAVPRAVMAAGAVSRAHAAASTCPRATSTESRATWRSTTRRWTTPPLGERG